MTPRTWGGARKGSGRKPTGNKGLTFQASRDIVEIVEQQPNKSKFLGEVVRLGIEVMMMKEQQAKEASTIGLKPLMMHHFDNRVAAGTPIDTGYVMDEMVDITSKLCSHPEQCFTVEVSGSSMIEMGIFDGDTAIIDSTRKEPMLGKAMLCELNGEYTIKKYASTHEGIFLIPANKDYEPIAVAPTDRLRILGTVVSSIHRV